jgi:hypothetical protein
MSVIAFVLRCALFLPLTAAYFVAYGVMAVLGGVAEFLDAVLPPIDD